MKRLKKILIRAAIGISVLLLIFVGFLWYRNMASYKNVIHKDANAVVKIRVDAIGRSIIWDALKNPSYYYERQKEKDTIDDDETKGKGFGIPANIFLYTITGKSASTIFTSFKISNKEDFKTFLSSDFKIEYAYHIEKINVSKNNDGSVIAAYTNAQCVLVYNPKKEILDAIFKDILIDKKTLSSSNGLFKTLKNANADINYVTSDGELSIDFVKGKATIQGHFSTTDDLYMPTQTESPKFSDTSSLKFHLNATSKKKHETITFKDFKIEPDSLFAHYKGNLMIEIAGGTQQRDTIISYEYNDDFEKVATKTLTEKEVPEITLQVSADAKRLLKYLENVSIVENGMLNKNLFPLYQVKIDTTSTVLRACTSLNKSVISEMISHKNVFALTIDFEKLTSENQFQILNPYFEKLLKLELKGSKTDSKTIKVEGACNLKNKEILAIAQFL